MGSLTTKRVYDSLTDLNGKRVLVDRIWPRGISKEKLILDWWAKEIAPSNQLRKEFNHQPEKFDWFSAAYTKELQENPLTEKMIQQVSRWIEKEDVLLLYGAKDSLHNQAVVLKKYIVKQLATDLSD